MRNVTMQHTAVCYMSVQTDVSCTSFSGYTKVVRPNEKSRLQRGANKFHISNRSHHYINADYFHSSVSVAYKNEACLRRRQNNLAHYTGQFIQHTLHHSTEE